MKQPMSPCLDCECRYISCHASCEKYINFRRFLDNYNEIVKDNRDEFIQRIYSYKWQTSY